MAIFFILIVFITGFTGMILRYVPESSIPGTSQWKWRLYSMLVAGICFTTASLSLGEFLSLIGVGSFILGVSLILACIRELLSLNISQKWELILFLTALILVILLVFNDFWTDYQTNGRWFSFNTVLVIYLPFISWRVFRKLSLLFSEPSLISDT